MGQYKGNKEIKEGWKDGVKVRMKERKEKTKRKLKKCQKIHIKNIL